MKLNFKPMVWMKTLAASASIITMCVSPLALGAEAQNQKQMVNEYLKATGWGAKQITVSEYWQKVRHVYPESMRRDVDVWVSLNKNELMPKVDVTTYKDRNGQDQLRISLSKDGQVVTLTNTGDDDKNIKINNVTISKTEMFNHRIVAKKMAEQDPTVKKSLKSGKVSGLAKSVVLNFKEFSKLTARQKAEYMVRLRYAAEAAQNVYKAYYGAQALNDFNTSNKNQWALEFLLGEPAHAAGLTGKPCIIAGWLGKYGENQSCGGKNLGANDLTTKMFESQAGCAGTAVACNPMVYGFAQGGSAHCVPRADVKYATRECNKMSPLRRDDPRKEGEDKKRIIESYLKTVKGQEINLVLNDEGKISQDQFNQISAYLGDLQIYIDSAIATCETAPLKDIQKARQDQVSACEEIRIRAFSLQTFVANPVPGVVIPPSPPTVRDCDLEMAGSILVEVGAQKECVCPVGSQAGKPASEPKKGDESLDGQERRSCIPVAAGEDSLAGAKDTPIKGKVVDSCGFWCRNKNWIIPVGIFAGIFALLALFTKKKKPTTPAYVPPVTVTPTTSPSATPTLTPAPTLPPAPVCPYPNMMVGGVCTPPAITPIPTPPPIKGEGGTTPDTNVGGGVR